MTQQILLTESDSKKAKLIWSDYQQSHDLSKLLGQTAGIDPQNGFVWVGKSIQDIMKRRKDKGYESPLIFERIGSESYYSKGRRS